MIGKSKPSGPESIPLTAEQLLQLENAELRIQYAQLQKRFVVQPLIEPWAEDYVLDVGNACLRRVSQDTDFCHD